MAFYWFWWISIELHAIYMKINESTHFHVRILPRSQHTCINKNHSRSHTTDRGVMKGKMWMFTSIYEYLRVFTSTSCVFITQTNTHANALVFTHNHMSFTIRHRSIFVWKLSDLGILMKIWLKFEVFTGVCGIWAIILRLNADLNPCWNPA